MKSSRGFTLLEVMMAVAVLAVSLLAIFNLQSTSLLGSARAQKISLATQLARAKMSSTLIELEAGIVKGEFPEEKEEFDELMLEMEEAPPPMNPYLISATFAIVGSSCLFIYWKKKTALKNSA